MKPDDVDINKNSLKDSPTETIISAENDIFRSTKLLLIYEKEKKLFPVGIMLNLLAQVLNKIKYRFSS